MTLLPARRSYVIITCEEAHRGKSIATVSEGAYYVGEFVVTLKRLVSFIYAFILCFCFLT